MKKITALFFISQLLTACALENPATPVAEPVNQAPNNTIEKYSQTGSATLYLCKDDKVVRVIQTKLKHQNTKIKHITLTFNGITEKLSSIVSETGTAYTNIHWRWVERGDGNAFLTSTVGAVLADICVKQN